MNIDAVESIGEVETGGANRPADKVFIEKVTLTRKGSDAEDFAAVEAFDSGVSAYE